MSNSRRRPLTSSNNCLNSANNASQNEGRHSSPLTDMKLRNDTRNKNRSACGKSSNYDSTYDFGPSKDNANVAFNDCTRSTNQQSFSQNTDLNSSYATTSNRCYQPYSSECRFFNLTDSNINTHLELEYNMARNKQIVLDRLRAEEAQTAASQPRSPLEYARQDSDGSPKTQMICSRGGPNTTAKPEKRQQCRPQESARSRHSSKSCACYSDMNQLNSVNSAKCSPAETCGHSVDHPGYVPHRRLNSSPTKEARAVSCPTPVEHRSPHSSVQRLPRMYTRLPSQSTTNRPSRPATSTPITKTTMKPTAQGITTTTVTTTTKRTTENPTNHQETATMGPSNVQQTATGGATVASQQATTLNVPPARQQTPMGITSRRYRETSLYREPDFKANQQQTKVFPSEQQAAIGLTSTRYGDTSPSPEPDSAPVSNYEDANLDTRFAPSTYPTPPYQRAYSGTSSLERSAEVPQTYNSPKIERNIFPNYSTSRTATHSCCNQTPLLPPAPTPISTPELDIPNGRTDSCLNRSRSCVLPGSTSNRTFCQYENPIEISDDCISISRRTCPSTAYRSVNSTCSRPAIDYDSMSYVDLTDEPQYPCEPMGVCEQDNPCSSFVSKQNCNRTWTIPEGDESTRKQNLSSSYPGRAQQTDEMVATDMQLPSSWTPQYPPAKTCEQQPRASLFKCLAKKLSSTYDFLSNMVASQKSCDIATTASDQTSGQICNTTTTYGFNNLFSTPRPRRRVCNVSGPPAQSTEPTSYSSSSLYKPTCAQSSPLAPKDNDTAGFGLKTLFGNKTQLTNIPESLKECAIAKRCGRVQFDNKDKDLVQDANRTARRQAEFDTLVKDAYCPGIIQETIDGQENFNRLAINLTQNEDSTKFMNTTVYEGPSSKDPMTLLEAFSIRIDNERTQIDKDILENTNQEQIVDTINDYFNNQNPTDLNRSIKSLMLSEYLQEQEELEQSKGASLEADVQKLVTTFPHNAQMKFIFYTGHTKPLAQGVL